MMEDEDSEDVETTAVFRAEPSYGRGKAPQQLMRTQYVGRPGQVGMHQGMTSQPRYPDRQIGFCFVCGSADHYANVCPFKGAGQGAPMVLPCQNCQEYGHMAPQCPKPQQARIVYKQVEVPPREQTGLNYGHSQGVEKPEK